MIRKSIAAVAVAGGLLVGACGGETVYITVDPTTTTAPKKTTTTTEAKAKRPPASIYSQPDYDPESYDTAIWSEAREFWWEFTTEQLLNMGLVICQQFDMGLTLDEVTSQLVDILIANGIPEYSPAIGSMTGAALLYLCPEHAWWLDTI